MALGEFARFASTLPDAILVVTGTGEIAAANAAAESLFGPLPASLRDLASEQGAAEVVLRAMSRSREPLAGGLTVRIASGERVPFRCDGALLQPASGSSPALVSMRFRSRDQGSARFIELTGRVDALAREIRTRRRAEATIRSQAETLEMIIRGAPLNAVLERLIVTIEETSRRAVKGSILLFDSSSNRLRHGAAPGLPQEYIAAIDGIEAGPAVGSCGTAAFRKEAVVVSDIATDPLWHDYRELALRHGLRACWSTPIFSSGGRVLGTFAVYSSDPGQPAEDESQTVSLLTRTASIAIERNLLDTQRTQLHESERRARAQAETANRVKDEFLATVSHELRTPLTAIVGWSRLLRDQPMDELTLEAVEAIDSSARAQAQIIEDLLDFSRIAADKLKIEPLPIDLPSVIREAVATVKPAADAAGTVIELKTQPLTGAVRGDADRVRQVVWNLLTNAIKFAPGGRISVKLAESGDGVEIVVRDDGEGIDPVFLPRVFDRFSQADSSSRRRHGGLGLGLAIVRRLVELHGGSIRAESEGPGRGAAFFVRLPYSAAGEARGAEGATRLPAAEGRSSTLAGIHLLLVEDDDSSREVFRQILERRGASVVATATAAEALAAFDVSRPDVIISDIEMPETDGYQLMRQLRAAADGASSVPAIALTAYVRPADRARALESGFDAHLSKPVDPDDLVDAIRRLLQEHSAAPTGTPVAGAGSDSQLLDEPAPS